MYRALVLLAVGLLLSGCPALQKDRVEARRTGYYIVDRGDTLYSIAFDRGLDFRDVAAWNGIRVPYTIYPGQRLRLIAPPGYVRPATPMATAPPAKKTPATKPPATQTRPAPKQPAAATKPPAQTKHAPAPTKPAPAGKPVWQWPTQGQVIRGFSADGTTKKGIAIAGKSGQPVRASAAGRVVYSGSGLIGYGELIIIKHNENFLSAYAHNERILVREGEDVKAGQQIARLGSTGTDRPMLHFEIRYDGKPVDPMRYLPKR
ncbi:MAG: peptidoglycan DD-metalloendopeptidase family protein [Chromatiales bacterium]|nr:peptidoglycan DD-metalloendopeptidase family protein [Chromatiales bacterium]